MSCVSPASTLLLYMFRHVMLQTVHPSVQPQMQLCRGVALRGSANVLATQHFVHQSAQLQMQQNPELASAESVRARALMTFVPQRAGLREMMQENANRENVHAATIKTAIGHAI